MQGTRDYIKFLKRGYGRVTQISAFDARNGTITNQEALLRGSKYDGRRPQSLDVFLSYVGLNEEEFYSLIEPTVIPPVKLQISKEAISPVWDLDSWHRE